MRCSNDNADYLGGENDALVRLESVRGEIASSKGRFLRRTVECFSDNKTALGRDESVTLPDNYQRLQSIQLPILRF